MFKCFKVLRICVLGLRERKRCCNPPSFLLVLVTISSVLLLFSSPCLRVLTELVSKMRDMQMDKTELGCLRAIILFNPGA